MTSIKLDENCDICFDKDGNCEIVQGVEDIIQAIRIELEQNREQWALNTYYGMPYLNKQNTGLLQAKNTKDKIKKELIKVISKYPVEKIISIEFTSATGIEITMQINGKVYKI